MSSWDTIQETPNQKATQIAFTAGSTISINAPASKIFDTILDYKHYADWNTWSPKFTFEDGQPIKAGSEGVLSASMGGKGAYDVPVKILECSHESHLLSWQGQMMPRWFGMAERVQVVTPNQDGSTCEVRNWESMSGWGVYVLDFFLGVKKQLLVSNVVYLENLKKFVEQK